MGLSYYKSLISPLVLHYLLILRQEITAGTVALLYMFFSSLDCQTHVNVSFDEQNNMKLNKIELMYKIELSDSIL